MSTIPASELVNVTPSVLAAGGNAVDTIGLVLTEDTRPPIGSVLSFPDQPSVADYFGAGSQEASLASIYFAGFVNSTKTPSAILFAQYNGSAVSAFMRGGDVSALTISQLQAITGTLDIVIDGVARNVASLNLSADASFSAAAATIQAALIAATPAAASVTGSIGGIVTASAGATFTGTGAGTNLTAASVVGVLHPGDAITGTGVPAGTYIVSQTSGTTGSDGVYVTNHATTSSSDALTASSNTLDVTGVTSGTIQPTDHISGSGLAAGTTVLAQISGTPGGIGLYTISSQQEVPSTAVTALSTVLNVTAVGSGAIEVGAVLSGTAVTSGTTVTADGTGSGGIGTYVLDRASTTISETIAAAAASPVVTYDSTSGGFVVTSGITGSASTLAFATGTTAAALKLTSATGAVLSQGAAAASSSPAAFMNSIVAVNSDWATFMTTFDPDGGSGNTVKQAFATWKNSQNGRFGYVCWDTDVTPTASVPATSSLGYILANNNDSGTCLLDGDPAAGWDATTGAELAAFVAGAAASINFDEQNGRITFAFKSQEDLVATVTTATIAANLGGNPQTSDRGNGYNFYGAYAQANSNFVWFQRGFVTGPYLWFDSFINQIWLNSAFQAALLALLGSAKSIPYNTAGYSQIETALSGVIAQGLNFGAFAPGSISASQAAQVNQAAGASVSSALQTQGYYLQVKDPSSSVRAARTSPTCKFWYLDRGSVQSIDLSSILVQ